MKKLSKMLVLFYIFLFIPNVSFAAQNDTLIKATYISNNAISDNDIHFFSGLYNKYYTNTESSNTLLTKELNTITIGNETNSLSMENTIKERDVVGTSADSHQTMIYTFNNNNSYTNVDDIDFEYLNNLENNLHNSSFYTFIEDNPLQFVSIFVSIFVVIIFVLVFCFFYIFDSKRKYVNKILLKDYITGYRSYYSFKQNAKSILSNSKPFEYVLLRVDVDGFKLINGQLGEEGGNEALKYIAQSIKKAMPEKSIMCRLESDHFVIMTPNINADVASEFFDALLKEVNNYKESRICLHLGVYEIKDPTMQINSICDRALLALKSVKHSSTNRIGYYSNSMYSKLQESQKLASELEESLKNNDFIIYLQPQINYDNNSLVGAEALVRWQHPKLGLISPAVFIPLFEQNGSIVDLDYYIWEKTCQCLKRWQTNNLLDIPISVNISRITCYNDNLCNIILSLIEKYDLKPSNLNLEITESAYMDNAQQLTKLVNDLKNAGFKVEMDDFGSGYSSLNTLKDLPVDLLKLDMKFLSSCSDEARGGNILGSILRMTRWLKLPTIAEGIETKQQADYLKSLGCIYMQGYFFDKPMPIEEFEKLYSNYNNGDFDLFDNVNFEGAAAFWDASTQMALIFNSFVGGAAIMEFTTEGTLEILRANDNFFKQMNTNRKDFYDKFLPIHLQFTKDSLNKICTAITNAINTGQETECEVYNSDDTQKMQNAWLGCRFKVLANSQNVYLIYASVNNISTRKLLGQELQKKNEELELSFKKTGYSISRFDVANYSMHIPESYANLYNIPDTLVGKEDCSIRVIPQDKQHFINCLDSICDGKKEGCIRYRTRNLNGNIVWEQATFTTRFNQDGKPESASIIIEDATHKMEYIALSQHNSLLVQLTSLCILDYDVLLDELKYSTVVNDIPITQTVKNYSKNMCECSFNTHPQHFELVKNTISDIIKNKLIYGSIECMANNNGLGYKWYKVAYTGIKDDNNVIYRIVGHAIDIQLEKEVESGLTK